VAVAEGQAARAARLFGAAAGLQERTGAATWPPARARMREALAAARATLGEADFAAQWATGRTLPLEAALAEAEAAT
jgi:hypothetical protein